MLVVIRDMPYLWLLRADNSRNSFNGFHPRWGGEGVILPGGYENYLVSLNLDSGAAGGVSLVNKGFYYN
jgi:hypothetical protein